MNKFLPQLCAKIMLFSALLVNFSTFAQTTIINPTGDGGFENGGSFLANGWSVTNDANAALNNWYVGATPVAFGGTNAAYISNTSGATWAYSPSLASTTHFYRDVTVPAGESVISLNFQWKGSGESGWDRMLVYVAPITSNPISGYPASSSTVWVGATLIYTQANAAQAAYTGATAAIPASYAGTTFRLIFTWQSDNSFGTSPGVAVDNIGLTSAAPSMFTSTVLGGQWSSPATWVGGVVPAAGNLITIPAGSIVTVDQTLAYAELNISGTLQWGSISYTPTIGGNITINPGGKYLAYTSSTGGTTGVPTNVGGNFVNNGYANLAVGTTTLASLTFNGAGSTLTGTGVFEGDGTRGIIRALFFSNIGANTISTTQPLTTYSCAHTAGSLNTNGLLKIDNTAQVYGQAINTRVESVHMTNMGSMYSVAPVVFGSAVTPYADLLAATLGTRYFYGNNVYLCTANGTFNATPPTSTSTSLFTTSGPSLIWIGTLGTIGTNIPYNSALSITTAYFYGDNLYQALTATAQTIMPTHTAGVVGNFRYLGAVAKVSVNYDAITQTVRSLSITNNGSGYNSSTAPGLVFSVGVAGGTGSGASAVPVILYSLNGTLNSALQKSGGAATITGGLTINSDADAGLLTLDPQASSGVGNIFTTNGGLNYTVAPQVGFAGPTAINLVTNMGSGYTVAPTITVSGGTLVSGTALTTTNFTITTNQGKVVSVYLNSGSTATYSTPPTLTMSAGTTNCTLAFPAGCWPAATANIGSNGQLTSFTMTNAGFGYVIAPTVGVGTVSGTPTGGTFTTVASAPTARVALYNLTLNYFAPAVTAIVNSDDAAIPTNRKLNNLSLAGNGNGLNLNAGLTLYGTTPMTLTGSLSVPGNLLDLGGNTLTFSWQGYAGTTSTFTATTNAYLKNGSMTVHGRGGGSTGSTYNFPFSATFTCFTGAGTNITAGSDIVRVNVTETAAPSNTISGGTGVATGNRAFRVQTQSALSTVGTSGLNPTVTLRYNAQDLLTSTQDQTFVAEGTSLAGQWTVKSAAIGVGGALAATGQLITPTIAPGPIALTGDVFYAWSGLAPTITSVSPLLVCASSGSFTITGTNFTGVSAVSIGGTPVASFTVVSPTQIDGFAGNGTTGFISVVKNGATTTGTQTIVVNPSPAAPSASPASATVLFGASATFTVTGAGGTYNWYALPNGGTVLGTGGSFTSPPACLNTNYYVAENNGSCEGPRAAVTINVTPMVAATSVASFCGTGGNTTLSASPIDPSITYTWTSNTPSVVMPITVGPTVTATLTETSELYLTSTANGCITSNYFSVGVYPLPSATVTTSASGVCPGTSATINSGLSSSNFTVSSIPYVPYTVPTYATIVCSDGVPLVPLSGGGLDDGGWGNIPIGFNFNFFGTNFSTLAAGTNGLLMFGAVPGYGTAAGQLGQFTFNGGPVGGSYQYFPNPANPGNVISLMAGDQYFGNGTNGSATSDLIYWTSGFAPNRVFNILYQDVNRCCGVANPAFTAYAKLFETIGTVEIHILNNNQSTYSNVVGLQDITKTIGAVAPGRPTQNQTSGVPTPWGVTIPEAWKFVPPANYTTVWTATNSVGTTTIANGTNIFSQSVAPLETTTYDISYTNQTTGCTNAVGSANVQMIIFSNIAPVGVNTVAPIGACDGINFLLSTDYVGTLNGIAFQWQVSIDGGLTYNDILGATATTYNVNQSITSMYRLKMIACSGTPSYSNPSTVINYALPVIGVTPNSAPFCQPGGTAVTMNASGGLTYAWAPAAGLSATSGTSVTASPSATTIYTVTGTDVNGCNSVATATISLSSSITLTNTGATPASVCPGGSSVLATTGSLAGGSYCQPTTSCTFPDMITNVTFSSINNTTVCNGAASGGFTLFPAFNPTINAGSTIPISVSTGGDIEGAAVWIDYNKNGTFEGSELVLDGYLGTNPATYTGTAVIPANATNGTTRMRVRCVYFQNPNAIGPCANANFGETEDYLITIVGGLDPLSYAWTPNTNLASVIGSSVTASNVLTPETYTVTATSSAGCTATATATINVFALPTVSAGIDQSICTGSPATLSGSGAVTYTWNNGVTNNVAFNPTSNTTYTVTGVDANGCSNVDDMNITMLALPSVNAGIDQAICINASTSVSASGAVTYTWNNNVVDGVTFSPTSTATYTVVGVGANGCINQDNMVVVVNPLPTVNAGPNYTVCEGQNITLTANTNGATVAWNNGVINGFPFTPSVGSTTYTVTASSGFGCTNIDSTVVVVNPTPTVSVSANQNACVGSPVVFTATVTSSPSGSWTTNGSGTIAPNVTNNSVTYTPSTNDAGIVYISYAAFNSCGIATDTATMIVNGVPTVAAGMDMTICSGESILLSGTGATTYTWNNGAVDNVTFVPTISGIYTVVGADTNGCTDTDDVLVTINQTPNATSTAIDPVTLVATPSGENYQWIDCATGLSIADATSDTLIALVNGEYAVVVSSSNGCSDTSSCITVDQVGLYIPTSLVISVYPNPTNGNVSISLPSNDQGVLSIYDAQGKLVQTTNSLKNGDVINLSTYTPGMYTFKIAFGELIHIERVIKN